MSKPKPIHAIYHFERLQRHRLALQQGAYARLLLMHCEAVVQYGLKPNMLFASLLESELYQYSDTGHLSLPLAGVHGPFSTARIKPDDFVEIPRAQWLLEIVSLIQQEKWQLPKLEVKEAQQVAQALDTMFDTQTRVFRLQLCEGFNASSYRGGDARLLSSQYHHEWSHALSEFHEYILVDEQAGRCDCLMLSYE